MKDQKPINHEDKIRQLAGIANLHLSIAKEIMASETPLTYKEIQEIVDLLKLANDAKLLAHTLKTNLERKDIA